MKQAFKKHYLVLIEIIVVFLCVIASGLSIYFFLFQFKQKELQNFNSSQDAIIISNYLSFKVEEKDVINTTKAYGKLNFLNDCVQEVELSEPTINIGESFSVGDVLGKKDGNECYSDCIGCVINIQQSDETGVLLSYIDFNKAELCFELDSVQASQLSYDDEYDCLFGDNKFKTKIKSICYDYLNSETVSVLFSIIDKTISSNIYLFDNEDCSLILKKDSQKMMSVDKSICKYLDLSEGQEFTEVFRDEKNNFSYGTIKVMIIGDERIGISSEDNILDKFLCIQK